MIHGKSRDAWRAYKRNTYMLETFSQRRNPDSLQFGCSRLLANASAPAHILPKSDPVPVAYTILTPLAAATLQPVFATMSSSDDRHAS